MSGRCDRCHNDRPTVHARKIGGGTPVPVCNGCTRKYREKLRLGLVPQRRR